MNVQNCKYINFDQFIMILNFMYGEKNRYLGTELVTWLFLK